MIDELMPLVDCDDCSLQEADCLGTDCKDAQRLSDWKWTHSILTWILGELAGKSLVQITEGVSAAGDIYLIGKLQEMGIIDRHTGDWKMELLIKEATNGG